jgi:1-acyl-sn-glycerol-3-phosphate acyltransferase
VSGARSAFRAVGRWYARRRVAAAFDGLFVEGLEEARATCRERAVVLAANHVAWWDAFVLVLLDRALETEGICLMDADNLARLPFFGWLGAVPLRRGRAIDAARDLQRAGAWLDRPGRAAWIFPQGRQRPGHLRPLGVARGVSVLASAGGAPVLPVSITYAFRDAAQPTIAVSIGVVAAVPRRGPLDALESAIIAGLDRNDAFVIGAGTRHRALIPPRTRRDVPLGGRLLARLGGTRG